MKNQHNFKAIYNLLFFRWYLALLLMELKINNKVSVRLILCKMLSITLACGFKTQKINNINLKKVNGSWSKQIWVKTLMCLKCIVICFLFWLFINTQSLIMNAIKLSTVITRVYIIWTVSIFFIMNFNTICWQMFMFT